MIICIQRVSSARVSVDGKMTASIGKGLLLLVGIEKHDTESVIPGAVEKIIHLRIFPDQNNHMNRDVREVGGELLVVSQFTLAGSIKKGRRPSFDNAALPDRALNLFEILVSKFQETGIPVSTGQFQAVMDVELVNDGPVTFVGQW